MKTIIHHINKWLGKTCLAIFGLVATLGTTNAQTQNNIWSLPPNYLPSTSSPQPLPNGPILGQDYKGEQAQHVHNAMQDANGNLLFFVLDGKVFDKDGYLIDEMYNNNFGIIPGGQRNMYSS